MHVRLSFNDRRLADQEAVIQVVAKVLFGGNTARLKNLVVNVATGAEEELDKAEPDAVLPLSLKFVLKRGPNRAIMARNAEERRVAAQALEERRPRIQSRKACRWNWKTWCRINCASKGHWAKQRRIAAAATTTKTTTTSLSLMRPRRRKRRSCLTTIRLRTMTPTSRPES